LLLSLSISCALSSCAAPRPASDRTAGQRPSVATPTRVAVPKIDATGLPPLVRFSATDLEPQTNACADFDGYANGKWRATTAIPADQSSWGSWEMLTERSLAIRHQLAEQAARASAPDTNTKIVGDLWATGMDADALNALDISPLQPELRTIDALDTPASIADYLRRASARGSATLFSLKADADFRDSGINIAYVERGGLVMPNPSLYLEADKQPLRDAYLGYITGMLSLTGTPDAEVELRAREVLAFETRLARAAKTREERAADVSLAYHPVSLAQADRLTPNFSWTAFFSAQGIAPPAVFSLAEPGFHQEISRMLVDMPASQWKAYLRFRAAHAAAPYLSDRIAEPYLQLVNFALGIKETPPRWKRVLQTIDAQAADPMGQLYVAVAFPPESKARVAAMVDRNRAALKTRLEHVAWMSDSTRQKALAKWATFHTNIGYPDRWRDVAGLATDRSSYFANVMSARAFNHRWNIARIGRPVDRSEWEISPQTVNANYTPARNEITFPAAFLQPPFFDPDADDALNFGGIGAVIGHEMIHGYDDQGSRFGASGNFEDWWSPADRAEFKSRTDALVAQFDAYEIAPGAHVNGAFTLSENIADVGGLAVAHDALQLATASIPDPMVDGLSRDQRFFLGWTTGWRTKNTPEFAVLALSVDEHAPSSIRSFGAPANLPVFATSFGCKPGDAVLRGAMHTPIW